MRSLLIRRSLLWLQQKSYHHRHSSLLFGSIVPRQQSIIQQIYNDKPIRSSTLNSFRFNQYRFLSSSSNNNDGEDPETISSAYPTPPTPGDPSSSALSPVNIPDYFPILPVIAINRNPVFPKFVKLIELTDPNLIQLIKRKVDLRQPYAGIFMKRNDNDMAEVVNSLDEIYPVGTFVQIHELQDLGDRIRVIVMAHRRIRIMKQIDENDQEEQSTDPQKKNGSVMRKKRARRGSSAQTNNVNNNEQIPDVENTDSTNAQEQSSIVVAKTKPVLMVEVEN
ncbi:hypothetical protein BLA29_007065, partial [Euroglyphus maynei]